MFGTFVGLGLAGYQFWVMSEPGASMASRALSAAFGTLTILLVFLLGRALGGTHMLPEEERHTLPEGYLRDRLAVLLGGRTAEHELLGAVSSGAEDDIRQATQLARAMVARWGMSEAIGPVDLRQSEEHPFLGREIAQPRTFSEATARAVDEAVQQLLQGAEQRAAEVIERHKAALTRLIAKLEAKETLGRAEIEAALGPARHRSLPRGSVSVVA